MKFIQIFIKLCKILLEEYALTFCE